MIRIKGKATMQAVAEAAGVSIATVSRAINQRDKVSSKTYQEVYNAMLQVGYLQAREDPPPRRGSRLILAVIPDIDNPFYARIVEGIHSAARRNNYQYLLHQTRDKQQDIDALQELVEAVNPAGIIFLTPVHDQRILENLNKIVPVVQCCEFNEQLNISYVSIDDFAASEAIVNYLISRGRKKIALINGPHDFKYARLRQAGYQAALKKAGIVPNPNWVIQMHSVSYEPVLSVVSQMLSSQNPPNAIYAVSDTFGIAAIKAAKKCGYSIPQDISVVGFDNTYLSKLCEPSLTTVSQPQFQLGHLSCETLIEHIHSPDAPPKQLMLDTELIVRDST